VKKSYKIEGGEIIILPDLQRFEDNQFLQESPHIELEINLKHQIIWLFINQNEY
jgi:hypothetical protein